jgi:cytoskeletal protein CcmA (bactofilin family)
MLGHKKPGGTLSAAVTLVSRGTEIVGDIHFHGFLEVEGCVRGNVVAGAGATVRIVSKGLVEGDLRAPVIIINGEVRGNVHADTRLELAPLARVQGDVSYALVEMAEGAEVNGRMVHLEPRAECGDGQGNNVTELRSHARREGGDAKVD